MSRSYRKHPISKDGGRSSKQQKKMANRKVRRATFDELPIKGAGYKKHFPQYDINDYVTYWSWQQAKEDWERNPNSYFRKHYKTLTDMFIYWLKCMKCK